MKIRPVGAELFHVDGRTDRQTQMTTLIVTFHNFANATKRGVENTFLHSARRSYRVTR